MSNAVLVNGANGMSDIEGKVAREAMSECGQRGSFNRAVGTSEWSFREKRHRRQSRDG